jgi:hypothetical protein
MAMAYIETALEEESESDASWRDIFTQGRPRFFQRLVLAIVSLCMLQISGVNLITYYASGSLFLHPITDHEANRLPDQ